MRELNVNEIQEINGGIIINPLTVALVIRAAQVIAPVVKTAVTAAVAVVAGTAGVEAGRS